MVFAGAFGTQWGIGLVVDLRLAAGETPADALRAAFVLLLALQGAAGLWFVAASRRGGGATRI